MAVGVKFPHAFPMPLSLHGKKKRSPPGPERIPSIKAQFYETFWEAFWFSDGIYTPLESSQPALFKTGLAVAAHGLIQPSKREFKPLWLNIASSECNRSVKAACFVIKVKTHVPKQFIVIQTLLVMQLGQTFFKGSFWPLYQHMKVLILC